MTDWWWPVTCSGHSFIYEQGALVCSKPVWVSWHNQVAVLPDTLEVPCYVAQPRPLLCQEDRRHPSITMETSATVDATMASWFVKVDAAFISLLHANGCMHVGGCGTGHVTVPVGSLSTALALRPAWTMLFNNTLRCFIFPLSKVRARACNRRSSFCHPLQFVYTLLTWERALAILCSNRCTDEGSAETEKGASEREI